MIDRVSKVDLENFQLTLFSHDINGILAINEP